MNVWSQCNATTMEKVRQREVDKELGSLPTEREVTKLLGKLKNGRYQVV